MARELHHVPIDAPISEERAYESAGLVDEVYHLMDLHQSVGSHYPAVRPGLLQNLALARELIDRFSTDVERAMSEEGTDPWPR